MTHIMHLFNEPFFSILKKQKFIEIRLNDEKRQSISIGDIIVFYNLTNCTDSITVQVNKLFLHNSFKELYLNIPYKDAVMLANNINDFLKYMHIIYSPSMELAYGVIGIKFDIIEINIHS